MADITQEQAQVMLKALEKISQGRITNPQGWITPFSKSDIINVARTALIACGRTWPAINIKNGKLHDK